ncbi:DgyrCDS10228 [Dimorphilus gyrociliatus]|uniref:DgyrCDS10228 n=1 Tax=Dimorphilus gyrociliatus TaxID=2664684 RepID=A0A7I8VZT1_9ANNE|nr:DgyrCDS10228 [Dimorphilus gyrociliatus]
MKFLIFAIILTVSVECNKDEINKIFEQAPKECKDGATLQTVSACVGDIQTLKNCSDQKPSEALCKLVNNLWDCMRNGIKQSKIGHLCAPKISAFAKTIATGVQPNCTLDNGYKKECSQLNITLEDIYVWVSGECIDKKKNTTCYDVTMPVENRQPVPSCGVKETMKVETCNDPSGAGRLIQSLELGIILVFILKLLI